MADTGFAPIWFGFWKRAVGAALAFLSIALAFDVGPALGILYYQEQLYALAVGLALFLFFHRAPRDVAGRGRLGMLFGRVEFLFAWLLLLITLGFAWRFEAYANAVVFTPPEIVAGGIVILLALLEAVRRVAGMALVIVVVAIFLYALSNGILPDAYAPPPLTLPEAVTYLVVDVNSILGAPVAVAIYIVIPFILLGEVLRLSGGSAFFTEIATALVGRSTGGSAKIAVVSSALFGSISGSAVANVTSTGVISIPLMKDSGYTPTQAGAIEAVASTGGQLLPPVMGATAFLMAEFLQIPYGEVVLAAIIPALLYYIAIFYATHLLARKRGIVGLQTSGVSTAATLRQGWFFLLGLAGLLALLIDATFRPEAIALLTALFFAVCAAVIGYGGAKASVKALAGALPLAGRVSVEILLVSAIAGAVIGLLNISGLSFTLSLFLVDMAGGSVVVLLILTAMASIVLGMGMPTTGVYVLLATVIAPALINLGIPPLAAHMFIFYFGMLSMVTPPVAMAAFAGATIAKAPPMRTAIVAMGLGWPAFVIPFLFVHSPALLFSGPWEWIALETALALVGVFAVTSAALAYWGRGLALVERVALAILGMATLFLGTGSDPTALAIRSVLAVLILILGFDLVPRLRMRLKRG